MFETKAGVFSVDVYTTERRGHTPEFWAEHATNKIINVADTAPMPIREQALAFRGKVYDTVLHYMRQAIASDRTTVCNIVDEAGRPELIKDLRST